jgi:hypothetical protein
MRRARRPDPHARASVFALCTTPRDPARAFSRARALHDAARSRARASAHSGIFSVTSAIFTAAWFLHTVTVVGLPIGVCATSHGSVR